MGVIFFIISVYERATRDLSVFVPWSRDQDRFEKETGVVRKIVEACGQLYDGVTCREMGDLGAGLSCDIRSHEGRMVLSVVPSVLSLFDFLLCEAYAVSDLSWPRAPLVKYTRNRRNAM